MKKLRFFQYSGIKMCQNCYISILLKIGSAKPVKWGVKLAKGCATPLTRKGIETLSLSDILPHKIPSCATPLTRKGSETKTRTSPNLKVQCCATPLTRKGIEILHCSKISHSRRVVSQNRIYPRCSVDSFVSPRSRLCYLRRCGQPRLRRVQQSLRGRNFHPVPNRKR